MALERKDKIGDTTSSTGTGTINLAAVAQTGARIFAGNVTSGATVRYLIESSDRNEWEVGEGVFTDASPDTLTRVTVYASSNAGSLVNFSAGTKNVSLVFTAADSLEHTPASSAGAESFALHEDTDNGTNKITITAPSAVASDKTITLPDATGTLALLEVVYPVGSVYISVVSTSPATLFGFGTWAAFAAGRTLVGIDTGQTEFDTVEETGGEKTHTLTAAESGLPAHDHKNNSTGRAPVGVATTGANGLLFNGGNSGNTNGDFALANTAANASSAHNNLQPYIVTYMWKRTA